MAMQERLDRVLEAAIGGRRLVGAVVVVARGGRIAYRRACGFADREARTELTPEHVFRLASLTKPVVTAAAMALIEQGKLALEDRLARWLPGFRPRLPDGRTPDITIRQLLTHTSGLSYGFSEDADGPYHRAKVSDGMDQPGLSLEENLRRLASVPLLFEPGSDWKYSLSLDVLGAVLQEVEHAPLPAIVRRLVTGPLGMNDTDFHAREPARLAVPYVDGSDGPVRMGDPHLVPLPPGEGLRFAPSRALDARSYPAGGVGMVGTADDFVTFLETLRKGGAPILSPASVRAMMSNQIGALPTLLGAGWTFGFGFAVLVDPRAAATQQSAGTIKWGGVYGHSWWVDPQRELSVVVLTDTTLEGMIGAFPQQVQDAVLG